jgi:N utilization substance protein B
MLYQSEVVRVEPAEVAATFWMLERGGTPASPAVRRMAAELAMGTMAAVGLIDPLLAEYAENWRLSRMTVVDRLILRLAVHELQSGRDVPPAVVIDEALELARTFSTEDAVKFVNGVLDAIRRRLEAPPPTPSID